MPGRGVRAVPAAHVQGIKWLPIRPTSKFYGQTKELEQMTTIFNLERPRGEHLIDISLTSSSGLGKSQLVLKFIELNNDKFKNIIWIPSNSYESIENTLLQVYRINNIYMESLDTWDCITRLYEQLCVDETLFVFDNALVEVIDYLPENRSKLTSVVTSQLTDWHANMYVPIRGMIDECAFQLVKDSIECNAQDAFKLNRTLHNNVLALKIAIQFIKHQQETGNVEYSINKFCNEFKESDNLILNEIDIDSNKKLLNILDKLLEMLQQENENGNLAIKILKLSSFLPNSGIKYLKNLHNYDRNAIDAAFGLLNNYSFINMFINDHYVVSTITKTIVRHLYKNEEKSLLEELISVMPEANELHKTSYESTLQIMKYAVKYDDLIEQYHEIFMKSVECKMCNGIDAEDTCILNCIEKIIIKLEQTLGWENDVFLRYVEKFLYYAVSLESNLEKMLELVCKIENLPDEGRGIVKYIKSRKVKCLLHLGRLQEAWILNDALFHLSYNNVQKNFKTFMLLEDKCEIACKISEISHSNTELLSCIPLLLELPYVNRGKLNRYEYSCLKKIMNQLIVVGKNNEALDLVSHILNEIETHYELEWYSNKMSNASKRSIIKLKVLKAECCARIGEHMWSWKILKSLKPKIIGENDHCLLLQCCKIVKYFDVHHKWLASRMYFKLMQELPQSDVIKKKEPVLLLEETLLARKKQNELLEYYKQLEGDDGYGNLNYLAKLSQAIILCKLNRSDEAWEIYYKLCTDGNGAFFKFSEIYLNPNRPNNNDEMLNMIEHVRNTYITKEFEGYNDEDE